MVRLATNGFFRFCRKSFGMKVERRFRRCTDIKCPLCLIKMGIPFGPFWPFLIGCMVSADYWLTDYPELRRTTQPSTIGSPLGEPGFCIFGSTAWWNTHKITRILHFEGHFFKAKIPFCTLTFLANASDDNNEILHIPRQSWYVH